MYGEYDSINIMETLKYQYSLATQWMKQHYVALSTSGMGVVMIADQLFCQEHLRFLKIKFSKQAN